MAPRRVVIESPARLHMGFIIPAEGTRKWAGIGLAVEEPATVVEASIARCGGIKVAGVRQREALEVASKASRYLGIDGGVVIDVRKAAPTHVGLGSGTQLTLSIWRALAELRDLKLDAEEVALMGECCRRSWIGLTAFKMGGFVIDTGDDGSRRRGRCLRLSFPEGWAVILCFPVGVKGLHGFEEERAIGKVSYGEETKDKLCRLLFEYVMPGVLGEDFELFCEGVELTQRLVGSCFKGLQGGTYHPASAKYAEAMATLGLRGIGQSSWGPVIYGFAEAWEEGVRAAEELANTHRDIDVVVTKADNKGAVVRVSE